MPRIKFLKALIPLIFISLVLLSSLASAHPGGLDKNGGHYNRATGEYHYHTKASQTPKDNPVEVYFMPSELDDAVSKMQMYAYICACFFYILCTIYNSIGGRLLKFVAPILSLFSFVCAISLGKSSVRTLIYLLGIWLLTSLVTAFGIYSIEKQTRILKTLGIEKRRDCKPRKY